MPRTIARPPGAGRNLVVGSGRSGTSLVAGLVATVRRDHGEPWKTRDLTRRLRAASGGRPVTVDPPDTQASSTVTQALIKTAERRVRSR
jgi:hypothetical protein